MLGSSELLDRKKRLNAKLQGILVSKDDAYEYFFKNSPGFCVIVELDGTIIDANYCFLEALGYGINEVVGRNVLNFVAKKDFKRTAEEVNKSDRFKEGFEFINTYIGNHEQEVKVKWQQGMTRAGVAYAYGEIIQIHER